MTVRAKFKCVSITQHEGEIRTAKLMAVSSGSEENAQFFKWTPSAFIDLSTMNPAAAAFAAVKQRPDDQARDSSRMNWLEAQAGIQIETLYKVPSGEQYWEVSDLEVMGTGPTLRAALDDAINDPGQLRGRAVVAFDDAVGPAGGAMTHDDILRAAQALVAAAQGAGVVLTIEQRPLLPLAMGHHETVVLMRQVRTPGVPS